MILYGYWRSGAAHRLRIALNLKGLAYEQRAVHLVRGEHNEPAYKAINPQGRVPSLQLDDGTVLIQSPAIIEWLEESHPAPPLLPREPVQRAKVRGVAAIIGCDAHPLGNVSPQTYLRKTFGADDAACAAWVATWTGQAFAAIERLIEDGDFCFGSTPGLADAYLVPEVFRARRFKMDLTPYPRILRVCAHCATLPAFVAAAPENQPDAEPPARR